MKNHHEADNAYLYKFHSNEVNSTAKPYLSVVYVNAMGMDGRWSFHTQSVGRAGTGAVNDFSGNLVFSHADAEIASGYMGVSLGHVYNTNDKNIDMGYGYGWRLNYHQTVTSKTINSSYYYEYIDGDGTRQYYKRNPSNT